MLQLYNCVFQKEIYRAIPPPSKKMGLLNILFTGAVMFQGVLVYHKHVLTAQTTPARGLFVLGKRKGEYEAMYN